MLEHCEFGRVDGGDGARVAGTGEGSCGCVGVAGGGGSLGIGSSVTVIVLAVPEFGIDAFGWGCV